MEGFLGLGNEESVALYVGSIVKSMSNETIDKAGSTLISDWLTKTKAIADIQFKDSNVNDYKSDLDKLVFLTMFSFFRGSSIEGRLLNNNDYFNAKIYPSFHLF